MSSTGRGAERALLDDYPSPIWTVDRLLDRVDLPVGDWVEISAGSGNIIRAARAHRWAGRRIRSFTGIELNEAVHGANLRAVADRALFGDFLKIAPSLPHHATALGNPPYEPAMAFIEAALPRVDALALLLRDNFAASETRHAFWCQNMPDTYLLPQRPTFVTRARRVLDGRGPDTLIEVTSNDSCDYAWFVWRRCELPRREGRRVVLDLTPDDVREAARLAAPVLFEDLDGSMRRITQAELQAMRAEVRERRRVARQARKTTRPARKRGRAAA